MMPQKREKKFIGAQNTEISTSADGDFGEMKKIETPSKSRRVGRYGYPIIGLAPDQYRYSAVFCPSRYFSAKTF